MKILHCCLACFYIDNYGYQENILPRQHKLDGHDVEILASTETYIDHKKLGYVNPGSYISESGIPITRVAYHRFLPHFIMRKLRIYRGVKETLKNFKPDIIFVHDCQFLGIKNIAQYARRNPEVKIFVDCHTDYMNSAKSWLSKYILHKIIYRYCANVIKPYVAKFFGVLPSRCKFLNEMYGIPKEKIELLVLGAEDCKIHIENRELIRKSMCSSLSLNENDFIIVTGGKIDQQKNIINLIKGLECLDDKNIKLIIFGSLSDDIKSSIGKKIRDNPNIIYVGWINSDSVYDFFIFADLVIFPGLHSVLWEQAIACGVPCIFRSLEGVHHVNVNGNCLLLRKGSPDEIACTLNMIISNPEKYIKMKDSAMQAAGKFLYSDIAKRSINAYS